MTGASAIEAQTFCALPWLRVQLSEGLTATVWESGPDQIRVWLKREPCLHLVAQFYSTELGSGYGKEEQFVGASLSEAYGHLVREMSRQAGQLRFKGKTLKEKWLET